jgi:hypothetical protein
LADGRVFHGTFHTQRMQVGEMSILDDRGRRKVYSQEYNYQKDVASNQPMS